MKSVYEQLSEIGETAYGHQRKPVNIDNKPKFIIPEFNTAKELEDWVSGNLILREIETEDFWQAILPNIERFTRYYKPKNEVSLLEERLQNVY